MKRRVLLFLATMAVVAAATAIYWSPSQTVQKEKGILEGQVTIGPICPVERPDMPCKPSPETYAARKILVFKQGSKVAAVDINSDGSYSIELEVGTYTIDINKTGIDRSPELPKQIEIKAGQTTKLNISIDTGIRTGYS